MSQSRKSESLDTNALLRFLLADLPAHTKLIDKMLASDTKYQIADIAVVEVAFVLEEVYRMSRDHIAENLNAIMAQGNFNCNRKLFSKALPLYLAHPKLSIVDCCLAIYAELQEALPLRTFDKKLATQLSQAALIQ